MERTFVMFKPDAMQRGLVGEIMQRFEEKGLVPVAAKVVQLDDALLKKHYAQYVDKPFFPRLCAFMKQSPVLCTVWQGPDAVKVVRDILGPTNGRQAPAGTIRGDFSISLQCNLVHASDSLETAQGEIKRFFTEKELVQWKKGLETYIYSEEERK